MRFRKARAPIGAALVALCGVIHPAWALGECKRFGTPSFSATRTVTIGGQTVRSKVYVRGTAEREEVSLDGHRSVRLVSPGRIVTWDPDAGTGTSQAVPKPPPPPKDAMRIDVADEGGNKRITISLRDQAGAWQQLAQTTCRPDGVPVAKTFTAPVGGTPVQGTMALDDVVIGPQDAALFAVPGGIRLKK